MSEVTSPPSTRLGWFVRGTNSLLSLAIIVGLFVALGFAFGAGLAAAGFIFVALLMAVSYWWGMKLRRRMKTDPEGTWRSIDRTNTAVGKLFAAAGLTLVGVCILGIIALIATHA